LNKRGEVLKNNIYLNDTPFEQAGSRTGKGKRPGKAEGAKIRR